MIKIGLENRLFRFFNHKVGNLYGGATHPVNYSSPDGEDAMYPSNSLSWRIYKNPVCAFIGGVSATYMQLSEPRVRTAIWEHSNFRENAALRFRKTGAAAMMRIYGPRSEAQNIIERVNRMHEQISGTTSCGKSYSATDPELLGWVSNTVTHSVFSAYNRFGPGVSEQDLDEEYALIGVLRGEFSAKHDVISSKSAMDQYISKMTKKLEGHEAIDEFTDIMRQARLIPFLKPFQRLLIRAAVSNISVEVREKINLDKRHGLRPGEEVLVKMAGRLADKVAFDAYPAVKACQRLGLPEDYLYRSANDNNRGSIDPPSADFHSPSFDG